MHASLTALSPSAAFFGAPGIADRQSDAHGRPSSSAPAVDSSELLKGQKTVAIFHNGSIYRLQATKLGKLILTK
ncbi:hemin uptake protein HemP [Paracidovorax cattleyae]|uniref:Hemin uptake protein hemP n=1 Tax=Paracidovorax cattleyae TaxID=80868 RepID=A0A1H0UXR4_9BURK|nr:hemin uptake protein HemP [Paracidovorax cattleyae]AVS74068.1 hemin uptake protein HemP [Paracidovorax cattleyae]MBF9264821.1 hemin uptake protein HemP [Paracidovorax cattleyae]SDP71062.1 Hemin uptake protein hemP [Paracidovorax cattleyae]